MWIIHSFIHVLFQIQSLQGDLHWKVYLLPWRYCRFEQHLYWLHDTTFISISIPYPLLVLVSLSLLHHLLLSLSHHLKLSTYTNIPVLVKIGVNSWQRNKIASCSIHSISIASHTTTLLLLLLLLMSRRLIHILLRSKLLLLLLLLLLIRRLIAIFLLLRRWWWIHGWLCHLLLLHGWRLISTLLLHWRLIFTLILLFDRLDIS